MSRKLSLVHNTTLSYAGQAYALLVGVLIMPFYLGHLGAEVYGLVGFFTVMQSWLQLLDVGLSASLVRQIAHHRGQAGGGLRDAGWLLRSFEIVFLPLTVGTLLAVWQGSGWIAAHWLNAQALSTTTLMQCITLMGAMVGLRLYATLYKSGLQGLEMHAWLNGANVLIATVRYFGGLVLVAFISKDALVFFEFQFAVALVEVAIFASQAYARLPAPSRLSGFNWSLVGPIVPFAASVSFTSVLWIVLTQLDKMLLSEQLSLSHYGYFSLVALMTNGILMLINPLVQTLLPRMTMLKAQARDQDMQQLYLGASRFTCTLLFPLAAVMGVHAYDLLLAWSGDAQAAAWGAPILLWYALGAAIMAASAFQYHLQYAHGRIRLHVWYSLISAAITVPVMLLAVERHGALGAALAWFILRLVSFAIWPHVVHSRLAPSIHRHWLGDILRISAVTALGLLITQPLYQAIAGGRLSSLLGLGLCGAITLALVLASDRAMTARLLLILNKPSVER
ncbi:MULTISPECIES: lipopolysaccharide biosynthesis protein [unclassified Pseudomonas]|uniref:lipopolysaccharide biosynthesis protein n=1 Tax=unclassified Pseudomonas TaxID=196821 RepID=UPI000BD882D0|nr:MULTISPECIES: oligosaccharide flippase family protein [unclassified Pseudomonas]PVZ15717.1 O-antigen/teichoic acid export membrane protein [Pseudomonas sp. URIL14HWK12:I12]PVZ25091.1 O-antigen/teichoic acid export membrane protein [Pseudomonas sp. URIL14HWK12:I10]PVZ34937.1 O-antigen/teichoic acid export membrane protein [Pseudomonas sp. URIL14HWK12:I11]SNZ09717.1 Membrane protein involved in the export of O-antigen and teichoic acid [Pseudomonas sp. URIL14HWK12:I9]